jgi:hypothetical protein
MSFIGIIMIAREMSEVWLKGEIFPEAQRAKKVSRFEMALLYKVGAIES